MIKLRHMVFVWHFRYGTPCAYYFLSFQIYVCTLNVYEIILY